jgi:hypothetical protein
LAIEVKLRGPVTAPFHLRRTLASATGRSMFARKNRFTGGGVMHHKEHHNETPS